MFGKSNGKDFEAIVEIFAKKPLTHFGIQVPTGGCNNADIDLEEYGVAHYWRNAKLPLVCISVILQP
jgi:hypothetical protein